MKRAEKRAWAAEAAAGAVLLWLLCGWLGGQPPGMPHLLTFQVTVEVIWLVLIGAVAVAVRNRDKAAAAAASAAAADRRRRHSARIAQLRLRLAELGKEEESDDVALAFILGVTRGDLREAKTLPQEPEN